MIFIQKMDSHTKNFQNNLQVNLMVIFFGEGEMISIIKLRSVLDYLSSTLEIRRESKDGGSRSCQ
jgi:hypothetical protein